MILRALLATLLPVLITAPGFAQETAHCWYAFDQEIGCSSAPAVDADGYLTSGVHAVFSDPTNRYGHNVLGKTPEWGQLQFIVQGSPAHGPNFIATLKLPKNRVFEDIAPRLADITGDGTPEIVVVESHRNKGARLAIYLSGTAGSGIELLAAAPYIGTPFRWLAPVGIADFNGDGDMDIAYVDRPHLARTLRIWTFRNGRLDEIAALRGVTNHRIGQNYITSGVRDCGQGPEIVLVDSNWRNVLAVRMHDGDLKSRKIAIFKSRKTVARALTCAN